MAIGIELILKIGMEFFCAAALAFAIYNNYKKERLSTVAYTFMLMQIVCQLISQLDVYCVYLSQLRIIAFNISMALLQIDFYRNYSGFKDTKFGTFFKYPCAIIAMIIIFLFATQVYYEFSSPHTEEFQILGLCHRELIVTTFTTIIAGLSIATTLMLISSSLCLIYFGTNNNRKQTESDRFWISFWLLIMVNGTWMILGVASFITVPDANTGKIEMSPLWYLPIAANGILVSSIEYSIPRFNRNTGNVPLDIIEHNLPNGNVHDAEVGYENVRLGNVENIEEREHQRGNVRELMEWHASQIQRANMSLRNPV